MKKLLFSILLAGLCTTNSFSQSQLSIGPSINAGISNLTGLSNQNSFNHPIYGFGASMLYSKWQHFGLGADIMYSKEGYHFHYIDAPYDYKETGDAHLVRIPIKAYYFFGDNNSKLRPKLFAGLNLGIKVGESVKMRGENAYTTDLLNRADILPPSFNSFDIGGIVGGGMNYRIAKKAWLNLDMAYQQGFIDALSNGGLSKSKSKTNMSQSLKLQAGVLFGI